MMPPTNFKENQPPTDLHAIALDPASRKKLGRSEAILFQPKPIIVGHAEENLQIVMIDFYPKMDNLLRNVHIGTTL